MIATMDRYYDEDKKPLTWPAFCFTLTLVLECYPEMLSEKGLETARQYKKVLEKHEAELKKQGEELDRKLFG